MVVSVAHRALHHAIDDLRTAAGALQAGHGDVPVLARLRNDLDRLILDVSDVDALPPVRTAAVALPPSATAAGETRAGDDSTAYVANWDEVDDEGVGGFRGGISSVGLGSSRPGRSTR